MSTARSILTDLEETPVLRAEEPAAVRELRQRARARFDELGLPTARQEEWRFTSLRTIAETSFAPARPAAVRVPSDLLQRGQLPGAHRAVVVDGHFSAELSRLGELAPGVTLMGLAEALQEFPAAVQAHFGRHADFHDQPFVALNTALNRDGVVLIVPPGTVVEEPIELVWVSLPGTEPVASFPRALIVAEHGARANVVERFVGGGPGTLGVPVTEIVVGPGAALHHHRLLDEADGASHIATVAVHQHRDSLLASHTISLGGSLVRNEVSVVLDGEGGECRLDGLYLATAGQHVDNHLTVRHATPHCTSHQLYKGVLDGNANGVFNGRIVVDAGAQKTDARQSNRNLLLSELARVNSNPQLEIYADDVRCTHGSTVGRLDEDTVFYLRSRGIPEPAARALLVQAFAGEMVERVRSEPLREILRQRLQAWLGHAAGEVM